MSQPPPPTFPGQPMPPYVPPQPPKSNGWAIASLICGILGCVPFITSLLAVIFGFLGIGAAKRPPGSGKGLSIAGIILGVLGIIGWGGFVVVLRTAPNWAPGIAKSFLRQPAEQVANTFVKNLADGDVQAAGAHAGGDLTPTRLTELAAELKSYGAFKSLKIDTFDIDTSGTGNQDKFLVLGGTATFENSTKTFKATMGGGSGPGAGSPNAFKVTSLKFE